jgi:SNF2 family DNA or RNA helicase
MKGEETVIGTGVRQISSRYKLVLTATPIKNRLPDVFRLAWWATGGRPHAHARFPYPDETSARSQFADEFLVSERNITKEREKPSRYKKLTPQVCNIHRLWKMFGPIILRRRKADCGEDIVTKTRQVVRAPMGVEQAAVYKFHLTAKYRDKNGGPAIGAQLQALRVAAANSASALLIRPDGDGKTPGEPRAKNGYIPKLHSALKIIQQCLGTGEQVILFSAFQDSLDILSARLTEAGIPHCVADGRTSPKRRGQLAAQFALGPGRSTYPVMLAGIECMSEGHSFPLCNNAVLMAYSWAWDKFEQAINRVHRLNSRWAVKIWSIICDGSIDRKLDAMRQEKGDAAELVLDGHLIGEQTDEVNLAELLEIARKEFADGRNIITIDEQELEKEWPPLRSELNAAFRGWRLKGLALTGVTPAAPVIELPTIVAQSGGEIIPGETETETRSRPSLAVRPPERILDLVAKDINLFDESLAGLPLFG